MVAIAPERSSKCFEFSLCFGNSPNYDAWLRRSIVKRDKKGRNRKSVAYESASESASASENALESECESESKREHVVNELRLPACVSDDESGTERVSESESVEPETMSDDDDENDENKHDDMPSLSPPRSKLFEAMGGMVEGDDMMNISDKIVNESDTIVNEIDNTLPSELSIPTNEIDSNTTPDDDSTEANSSSNDDNEFEVDSILSFRRVGKREVK